MVTMMTVCLAGAFEPKAIALLRKSQGTPTLALGLTQGQLGREGGTRLTKSLCCTGLQPLFRRFLN